ncbi:hypothetical protein [Myceligenerans xiligouense]|uniref:hypothetical protein n=1 Tax=Myceligenerans xiligouense TaxID=253184 RepID=UPI001B860BF3|nr:hypothetical protein [Myceligenerans xiligouense]
MTKDTTLSHRPSTARRHLRDRLEGHSDESGQAMPDYVGVIGLLMLVVGVVVAAATPVGADVTEQLVCAVSPIVKEDVQDDCGDGQGPGSGDRDGDGDDGGGRGGGGGGGGGKVDVPDDGYDPPAGDCEQDVTFDTVDTDLSDWDTSVVQIGCEWFPVPTICFSANMPDGFLDRDSGERVYRGDEIQDLVDCVTGGRDDPSGDPNDENCANGVPSSGEIDPDAPPVVQIGCRELPVPRGCEDEWAAYEDAEPGKERAGVSGSLANCVAETYDSIEIPCVVEATGHVDETNTSFLFFRWGNSNGTLIEKLGDGRIRIHILRGLEFGAGIAAEDVGGTPVKFDIAGITGYSKDKTYEFADMDKAQEWIDWYKRYNRLEERVFSPTVSACSPPLTHCPSLPHQPDVDDLKDLAQEEPEHHELAEAESDIRTVTLSGGLVMKDKAGKLGMEAGVQGGYEGEVQVEERLWSDGSHSATYTSSDIGGFLIGAKLAGKQPFTKGKGGKPTGRGSAGIADKVGKEWKGTTSTTVAWDKNGELSKLIITMDDQVMDTLYKVGIDADATLPYGFAAGIASGRSGQDGTVSSRQFIIDFNQYPELRDRLGPEIDEIFPRDDEGRLIRDDVEIDGGDADVGEVYEAATQHANVRELEYDASKVKKSGDALLTWRDVDLFKAEFTSVDKEKTLSESSFVVTDVDGKKQKMSPAPKCEAKDFEQPENYYSDDFSDPPTSTADSNHDLGAEHHSNGKPKYTEGTYPGTDYDGDVPGDAADRVHSLVDEYSEAFPDKNILVVKDFRHFSFRGSTGWEHLATVDGMDVIAIDEGTVKNKGDGGWINWGFTGSYDYDPDTKTVRFEEK